MNPYAETAVAAAAAVAVAAVAAAIAFSAVHYRREKHGDLRSL